MRGHNGFASHPTEGTAIFSKGLFAATLLTLAGTAQAAVLYTQAWDGTGNLYASQNDISGGNGNFATSYDDFTITTASYLTGFEWVGGYFNGAISPISAFTVALYADNGGVPGALFAFGSFGGNEAVIADPIYSYSASFADFLVGPGTYWVSFVPDIGFPPQWGWATSATGTNNAYQDFFGVGAPINVNLAFTVLGRAVPEPASWAMMIAGFGLVGAAMRRRATLVTVTA